MITQSPIPEPENPAREHVRDLLARAAAGEEVEIRCCYPSCKWRLAVRRSAHEDVDSLTARVVAVISNAGGHLGPVETSGEPELVRLPGGRVTKLATTKLVDLERPACSKTCAVAHANRVRANVSKIGIDGGDPLDRARMRGPTPPDDPIPGSFGEPIRCSQCAEKLPASGLPRDPAKLEQYLSTAGWWTIAGKRFCGRLCIFHAGLPDPMGKPKPAPKPGAVPPPPPPPALSPDEFRQHLRRIGVESHAARRYREIHGRDPGDPIPEPEAAPSAPAQGRSPRRTSR